MIAARRRLTGHFNPRSPHGERRREAAGLFPPCGISIHAPRTGSDWSLSSSLRAGNHFNPRSPHGERRLQPPGRGQQKNFNPRSPHGERRGEIFGAFCVKQFQSTLPARGATRGGGDGEDFGRRFQSTLPARGATDVLAQLLTYQPISIHAPRTGSDVVEVIFHGIFW